MTLRVLLSILLASISLAFIYYLCPNLGMVPDYYAKNIRGSLFTGFLTVGSFLLSLKAFIVVKLKENIFDSDIYKKKLQERRKLNPDLTLYGPVKRLSLLLFVTISSAITASVSQLSVGLLQCWQATFFCIFVSVFAISMLVSCLLLIKSTLDEWLDYLEDENNNKL
ncbi:hypothetical protein [Methylobacter tundripaludum]|uniref:hypothetical protein n=1 Tax=Methylobacter tundripaludum TaxID=173365 RepID=UPI00048847AD|nr:hypothetical protein [Methylobacter tundripaludum]